MKYRVGGRLDGRIALTGMAQQPMLTGALHVGTLSFDNRILGELDITSSFLPGSPDLALELALRPISDDPPEAEPAAKRRNRENRLHAAGTLRLPSFDADRARADDGTFDVRLTVDRADAFFFEYLFPEVVDRVEGHFEGRGSIRGSFRSPLFEGDLQLVGGRVDVPRFNLKLRAEGPVRVDADGVKLDDLSISDASGGSGVVSGAILFNDYRYFSLNLRGALDRIQIINVLNSRDLAFYGQVWASGNVTLTGPVSQALLRSTDAVTTPESNIFIPINESGNASDAGFIVFADSTGRLPDLGRLVRRDNLLARRPDGERNFLDGLEMDLNIYAPQGSTVHLVIDPLVGDVINAVGTGRIQLQRSEGEYFTYGELDVTSGDYQFTAGEVFFRRFLIDQGRITWDGDPLNATLDIDASYRTRASSAGLNLGVDSHPLIPLIVRLHVTGRVTTPVVDLRLAVERSTRNVIGNYDGLEAELNQPERAAQYATSVLLTNSFLLTTDLTDAEISGAGTLANTRNQLAFNSLSQLVASQLNRYLNHALPNVDLNFGVQGESTQDLDVTYGVALRLMDERLIIRGQGIYQNDQTRRTQQSLLDEFVVEMRLRPNVSVEVFYRREGEILTSEPLTSTTGAGLSYETQFVSWPRLIQRFLGRGESVRQEDEEVEVEPRVVQAEDS
jgi:translocation and assembly module TamB